MVSVLTPAGVMAVLVTAVVLAPTRFFGTQPLTGEDVVTKSIAVAVGIALVVTGAIHWRRWRLGGDRVQLALTFAAWMAAQSELSLHLGRLWHLSWWDYHALLLAGFGGAVYAIVVRSVRVEEHHTDLDIVYRKDLLAHIERGYPEALRALVAATEARDAYTRGHSRRVHARPFAPRHAAVGAARPATRPRTRRAQAARVGCRAPRYGQDRRSRLHPQ